jgi:D-beta-D-heptose 7-phosphate kinase/D-beta-D-heptose 1-phosphate adenosyltransferase
MKVVVISGYFNPLHTGHLDYIDQARSLGDMLIVIVNNDRQVKIKGSHPFLNQEDRLRIVSSLKNVDLAITAIDTDATVVASLQELWHQNQVQPIDSKRTVDNSMVFANGGDRKRGNTPEEDFCKSEGIETVYNVGGEKTQSSGGILRGAGYSNDTTSCSEEMTRWMTEGTPWTHGPRSDCG